LNKEREMEENDKKLSEEEEKRRYELKIIFDRRGYLTTDEHEEYIILLGKEILKETKHELAKGVDVKIHLSTDEAKEIQMLEEQIKLSYLVKDDSSEYGVIREKIYRRIADKLTMRGYYYFQRLTLKQGTLF
jgi:hypothetical protein